MLEQRLQHIYQPWFVTPLAKRLPAKLQPYHVSLLAIALGLCCIPAIYYRQNILAIFLLLLSGYCDTLDGVLARHRQSSSVIGSVLDIMGDRIVEFSVIFGLFLMNPEQRGLACIILLGSILLCVTSFLVVGIFQQNESHKSFHYSQGLIERAEAFVFFILLILLPAYFSIISFLLSGLIVYTAITRLYQFMQAQRRASHLS